MLGFDSGEKGDTGPELEVVRRTEDVAGGAGGLVGKAVGGGDTEARKALDDLFRIYWKPLYRYVRRTGKSPEDAEDLVQGFFGLLVTGDGLRLADRERGRFRASCRCSRRKNSCSQMLPGPPWSWLPGIAITGTFKEPMAEHAADTVALVTCGESKRSPSTITKAAPDSSILVASSRMVCIRCSCRRKRFESLTT